MVEVGGAKAVSPIAVIVLLNHRWLLGTVLQVPECVSTDVRPIFRCAFIHRLNIPRLSAREEENRAREGL